MNDFGFLGISAESRRADWLVIPIVVGGDLVRRRAFGVFSRFAAGWFDFLRVQCDEIVRLRTSSSPEQPLIVGASG